MSFNNSSHHTEIFPYSGYSATLHTPYHYTSDGSPLNGDESNFWSNSPRSESPSPTDDITQNALINSYSYFATSSSARLMSQRHSQYRKNYILNSSSVNDDTNTSTQNVHVPYVRVVKRRTTANKKERRRTQSINNAYADLRDCIPNVPPDTKLSKIKTLRLATSYINYLVKALESDDPTPGNFMAELASGAVTSRKSIMNNNTNNNNNNSTLHKVAERISSEDISSPNNNDSTSAEDINKMTRKTKGRTGWPQHVWALELEQDQAL